jgi:hypothetical protein
VPGRMAVGCRFSRGAAAGGLTLDDTATVRGGARARGRRLRQRRQRRRVRVLQVDHPRWTRPPAG